MKNEGGDGDDESEKGGDEGLGNTSGKGLGVTGSEKGDQVKGGDHAGDRAEKTNERGGCCGDGNDGEQGPGLCLDRYELFIERFLNEIGRIARNCDEAPK